jgi:hypothetical protein
MSSWRPLRVAAASLLLATGIAAPGRSAAPGGQAEALPHPNHYILLIDAVGSMMDTERKHATYQAALRGPLLDYLYGSGMGAIPAYNADQDLLSAYHFGSVRGGKEQAFARLKGFDFLKSHLHPVVERQRHISREALQARIMPEQDYNYSFFSWTPALAIWKSRAPSPTEEVQRTFLIFVHNNGRLREEQAELRDIKKNASPEHYQRVEETVAETNQVTAFRDGNTPVWAPDPLPGGSARSQIYFQGYEVISTAREEQITRSKEQSPLEGLRLAWGNQGAPGATLSARLRPGFWKSVGGELLEPPQVTVELEGATQQAAWSGDTPLRMALPIPDANRNVTRRGQVVLSAAVRQPDPWLGTRTVRYTYQQPVTLGPPGPYTFLFWFTWGLVTLAAAAALSGCGWWAYGRFAGSMLRLGVPGQAEVYTIPRRGRQRTGSLASPQPGLTALLVTLPPVWKQQLLYRGARLRIESAHGTSLAWANQPDPTVLELPCADRQVKATWDRAPAAGTLCLVFEHGQQQSTTELPHPQAAIIERRREDMEAPEGIVRVGLDLGSESMAAYFRGTIGDELYQELIDLQKHGDALVGNSAWKLRDDERLCRRLLTRIGLIDYRVESNLPDAHALLDFLPLRADGDSGYKRCLYRYFYTSQEDPLCSGKLMPNPKIHFQVGGSRVLPTVYAIDKTPIKKDPARLLHHMIVQVVRNFVLGSELLKDVDRHRIQLTITIPNVYSLAHLKSIKQYVEKHAGIPVVDLIYESDAVAYWVLGTEGQDNATKLAIDTMLRDGQDQLEIRLVTIDVGRGTTDLSMILHREADGVLPAEHEVLARTGRSDGGNRLSYLLAEHYDRQLRKAFSLYGTAAGSPHPPFLFTGLTDGRQEPSFQHKEALSDLEPLINKIKRTMDKSLRVEFSEEDQLTMIAPIVEHVVAACENPNTTTDEFMRLRNAITQALIFPCQPGGRFNAQHAVKKAKDAAQSAVKLKDGVVSTIGELAKRMGWKQAAAQTPPTADPNVSPNLDPVEEPISGIDDLEGYAARVDDATLTKLKLSIRDYIQKNVVELLEDLFVMALTPGEYEPNQNKIADLLNEIPTYVIVAGQASQFKPMHAAILETLTKVYHLGPQRFHFLDGPTAKEACCIGAVSYQRMQSQLRNPDALFGLYGFLNTGRARGEDEFAPVDMQALNRGDTVVVKRNGIAERDFIFTTRAARIKSRPPTLKDGSTAYLYSPTGHTFEVRYEPENTRLTVNDTPVQIANFGQVREDIWPKVWPEMLGPVPEERA